jgi:acetyl-CoA acetyltransferase
MIAPAIVGLGLTPMSVDPGGSAEELGLQAAALALADAGVGRAEVDGLLVASSQGVRPDRLGIAAAQRGGFHRLRLLEHVELKGASVNAMIDRATQAVAAGRASKVLCVFADAPLRPGGTAGSTYAQSGGVEGVRGLERASGVLGSVPSFALLAARYLHVTGGDVDDLAGVVCTTRAWALGNPDAVARTPLTPDDYFASRMVSTPLRVLDCARPVNGAGAFLVADGSSSTSSAAPVHVRAVVQDHPVRRRRAPRESWFGGDADALDAALATAGRTRDDLDILELYDPFSVVTLCLLEDYGFCEPGKAGAFVREGGTSAGGPLPTNTGGGQLSGFYLQGVTPLAEAVVQLRGAGGDRQVDDARYALVAAIGGRIDHHALVILEGAR